MQRGISVHLSLLVFAVSLVLAGCGRKESPASAESAGGNSLPGATQVATETTPAAAKPVLENVGGRPVRFSNFRGGVLLTSPTEIRVYFPEITSAALHQMGGWLKSDKILTTSLDLRPAPEGNYLRAQIPHPVQPPVELRIQIRSGNSFTAPTSVTLDEIEPAP